MDLPLAARAKRSKQTSKRFGIGSKTMLKHRARVLEKLRVDTPVELVHLAYRFGLVSPISTSRISVH